MPNGIAMQVAEDDMRESSPTTIDAVLREIVAAHRVRALGIPAEQLAMHLGLPSPDVDLALAQLDRDGAVRITNAMGYVPTASGYNVLAEQERAA